MSGIDHIYVAVTNLERSEAFYDKVLLGALSFRKNSFTLDGETHIQYFDRYFGYVIRPARNSTPFDSYAPGLHHLCFRVDSVEEVLATVVDLRRSGIDATEAKLFAEYAPDYWATFFADPDGIRLEVTNYRAERRSRHDNW